QRNSFMPALRSLRLCAKLFGQGSDPMSKERSKTADFAVYLVVRIVVCLIQSMPYRAGCTLAGALAWLAYRLDKRHREVARDNLSQAFPGRFSDAQTEILIRQVYRHFCTLLIDIIHLPRKLNPRTWRRHLEIPQISLVLDCLLSGRPVLL